MRREERVTVQGPVKERQPDGMSHRGGTSECVPHVIFTFHSVFLSICSLSDYKFDAEEPFEDVCVL